MCESVNLIISGFHCWAVSVKPKAIVIKRSEDNISHPCSLTRRMCQCTVQLKTK